MGKNKKTQQQRGDEESFKAEPLEKMREVSVTSEKPADAASSPGPCRPQRPHCLPEYKPKYRKFGILIMAAFLLHS